MSAVAAIIVGAVVYEATAPESPVAPEVRRTAMPSSPSTHETLSARAVSADTAPALPTALAVADPEESTIAQYAAEKYQFLLDDLGYLEAGEVERLTRALQQRERIAGEPDSAQRTVALANVEGQIRATLNAADYATYELLRESDLELFKLNEYAGGISNVAPLSAGDRESILRTKLAYKARFRQLMQDSGLQRDSLTPAERNYAYSITARALEDFRRGYLQEVRQYLANEEQFALLSNYEATEFKADLAQLQSMANAPAQGGS